MGLCELKRNFFLITEATATECAYIQYMNVLTINLLYYLYDLRYGNSRSLKPPYNKIRGATTAVLPC